MASTPKLPNFKQLQLGFQTSQRGTKKKENHLHTISKMMGTLVHVQLYTFSYRKPVIRPQNMPKTADWGQKRSKLWYFKMGPQVQPKCFRHLQHMRNNSELRKRGYIIRFGHPEALLLKKNRHKTAIFPVLQNLTHMMLYHHQKHSMVDDHHMMIFHNFAFL